MFYSLISIILAQTLKKLTKMKKLQRVKVALPESERWFRAIFNQTFGFIRLIEPIEILMKGNQVALKFGVITNSKVIRSSWWRT